MAILNTDRTLAGAIVVEGGQGTMILTLGDKEVPVKLGSINYPFTMPLGTEFKLPGNSFLIEDTDATPLGGADIFYEGNVNPGNYTIVSGDGKVIYNKGQINETNINLNTFQNALAVGTGQITYEGNAFAFIAGRSSTASLIGGGPFHITNNHHTGDADTGSNDRATATDHPVIRAGKGTALLTDMSDAQVASAVQSVSASTGNSNVVISLDPSAVAGTVSVSDSSATGGQNTLTITTDYTVAADGSSVTILGAYLNSLGITSAEDVTFTVDYEAEGELFSVKVRLDELSYPFTLVGTEELRPLGASFILASRS